MTQAEQDIRSELEGAYDIPFEVRESRKNGEPAYVIGPANDNQEFFRVHITFQNHIRMSMNFEAEKYSANFIRSMARKEEEYKARFRQYINFMSSKGARCSFKVNGTPLQNDISQWPDYWYEFSAKVTKMPVTDQDKPDYVDIAKSWGTMMMGTLLSLADIVPLEDNYMEGYAEGDKYRIETNKYERNPLNRQLCIQAKGYSCCVCGMNFEDVYGELGHHYIHVHHVVPVSEIGPGYIINPIRDLVPVCPNCHAMLHRGKSGISVKSLKKWFLQKKLLKRDKNANL